MARNEMLRVQAVSGGVQKIDKGKKTGLGETEPGRLEWVGLRADPGGMYISGVGQIFSHFYTCFLSLPTSFPRFSLLALKNNMKVLPPQPRNRRR